MLPRVILCDIEGTTTSISFAKDVLFPLSYEKMDSFIREHWDEDWIRAGLNAATPLEAATLLKQWIAKDEKEPILKQIQGKIWRDSFEAGKIKGHVYADVPVCFRRWHEQGIRICIFSSGSVEAQELIFKYSEAGDLTPLISAYFDTAVGTKRKPESYRRISESLQVRPDEILFLSDVVPELDAARSAGMRTVLLMRDKPIEDSNGHLKVRSFSEIDL